MKSRLVISFCILLASSAWAQSRLSNSYSEKKVNDERDFYEYFVKQIQYPRLAVRRVKEGTILNCYCGEVKREPSAPLVFRFTPIVDPIKCHDEKA